MNCNLSDPEFCESGAFGAGMTALDGPKLASLSHVCSVSPKYSPIVGRLSVRIGINFVQTKSFVKVEL